jgi:hypothetical protein
MVSFLSIFHLVFKNKNLKKRIESDFPFSFSPLFFSCQKHCLKMSSWSRRRAVLMTPNHTEIREVCFFCIFFSLFAASRDLSQNRMSLPELVNHPFITKATNLSVNSAPWCVVSWLNKRTSLGRPPLQFFFSAPQIRDLRHVFMTQEAQPIVISGGGGLGWDLAIANLMQSGDQAVVVNCGFFSEQFNQACAFFCVRGFNSLSFKKDSILMASKPLKSSLKSSTAQSMPAWLPIKSKNSNLASLLLFRFFFFSI